MEIDNVYARLGKLTEEMYFSIKKVEHSAMQDQIITYHCDICQKLNDMYSVLYYCKAGDLLKEYKRKIKVLISDFQNMRDDISSKYKVYLRGCGNVGKSTLLNALLSLDEETGSSMGHLPMTFTIDTYSDELEKNKAEIRTISREGNCTKRKLSREEAMKKKYEEEEKFKKSKEDCNKRIKRETQDIYLEDLIEDKKNDIYKKYLLKTEIREIKWGIGENKFFHNCVLVDTPGLSQELRFTNTIEDIKNYEVDGILWVISSNRLENKEVIESYTKEFDEFKEIYSGKKVVGIVNVYGSGSEYEYNSKNWQRYKKAAEKIYCKKYGFDRIILVNAKLAYDGNIFNNEQMIEKSNIAELRKHINEMFVEKTSEKYFTEKLKQIDSFVDNFCKEVVNQNVKFKDAISEYDNKKNRIYSQENSCRIQLETELNELVSDYLKGIRNRIDVNRSRVENLHNEDSVSRSTFIHNVIIKDDELQIKIKPILLNHHNKITNKFESLQKNSIISEFKTEKYVIDNFKKNHNIKFITENNSAISVSLNFQTLDKICDFVNDIFGKEIGNFFHSIAHGILGIFVPPHERLYKKIEQSLLSLINNYNLDKEIDYYVNQCMNVLDKSMCDTYVNYDYIKKIVDYMQDFINSKPKMQWKEIRLMDII